MDGTRIADLDALSTDDTHLFRVRPVEGSDGGTVASGAAALESDERTAATVEDPGADDDADDGGGSDSESSTGGPTDDDGIARPDDLSSNGDDDDVREAILLRLADGDDGTENGDADGSGDAAGDADATDAGAGSVVCWLNYCQHMTHIKLDKGSGAPVRDGEVICANHGAMFDADSGLCTYGPCEGAYLNELAVDVTDGGVYLADEDYEYVGDGPTDSDDDLSSSSNVIL